MKIENIKIVTLLKAFMWLALVLRGLTNFSRNIVEAQTISKDYIGKKAV